MEHVHEYIYIYISSQSRGVRFRFSLQPVWENLEAKWIKVTSVWRMNGLGYDSSHVTFRLQTKLLDSLGMFT